MAGWWSEQSNGKTIFYKLPEHLAAQYKVWKSRQTQRETMVAPRTQRQPNERRIRSSEHIAQVLPAHAVFEAPVEGRATQKQKGSRQPNATASSSRMQIIEIPQSLAAPAIMHQPQPQTAFVAWDQAGKYFQEKPKAGTRTCQLCKDAGRLCSVEITLWADSSTNVSVYLFSGREDIVVHPKKFNQIHRVYANLLLSVDEDNLRNNESDAMRLDHVLGDLPEMLLASHQTK
ncbi:hypothetical protein FB451DRAFT_1185642 [Mycena latifolia]|nr:hypothetical protein FB451DRAFT_1185642 [Mycena latifolia]